MSPFVVLALANEQIIMSKETLVTLSSLVCFSMFIKLFDWMRLFKKTAHYITLIKETLLDSWSFLIILVANLMLFGVPMSIIDLNRTEGNALIEGDFSNWVVNDFVT